MNSLESDKMTALWESDCLTFTFYCILAYLHTCIIAYMHTCMLSYLHIYPFFSASESDWSGRGLALIGKCPNRMSLDNIGQY